MITNVAFNDAKKGRIASYATYCITPSKAHVAQTSDKERLVAFECNGVLETPDARLVDAFEREIKTFNRQWKQGRKLKETSKDAVVGVISFGENDDVNPDSALALAKEAVSRAMPGTRKTMFAVHNDANVLHVHFIASTVDMETGKAYAPTGEYGAMYRSWERVNEALELENPTLLQHVQQRYSEAADLTRVVQVKATKYASTKQVERAGIETRPDVDLKQQIIEAYEQSPDFTAYLDNLELAGVRVVPNMGATKCSGLSYALLNDHDNRAIKGSELGKKFSFNNLSKEKNYDYEQHFGRLQDLRDQTPRPTAARDTRAANNESRFRGFDPGAASHQRIIEAPATGGDSRAFTIVGVGSDDAAARGQASGKRGYSQNGQGHRQHSELGIGHAEPNQTPRAGEFDHGTSQPKPDGKALDLNRRPDLEADTRTGGSIVRANTGGGVDLHVGRDGHLLGGAVVAGSDADAEGTGPAKRDSVQLQNEGSADAPHLSAVKKALGDPPLTDEELAQGQGQGLVFSERDPNQVDYLKGITEAYAEMENRKKNAQGEEHAIK